MTTQQSVSFSAVIKKIGINPYVTPPQRVLRALFAQAGKDTSPIPIQGTIDGTPFTQTLVRYAGAWRLYINGPMLKAADTTLGDRVTIHLQADHSPRLEPMHKVFAAALATNTKAKAAFDALIPSRRKEINRYLNALKTEATLARNIGIVMEYLEGKKGTGLQAVLRRGDE